MIMIGTVGQCSGSGKITPGARCSSMGVEMGYEQTVRCLVTPCTGVSGHGSRSALGLVVPGGIELEVSQERSAGRDDPDVLVVGEDEDGLSGVAAADSDVVQAAVVAQGEFPVGVDGVVPDAVVAVGEGLAAGGGLGSRGVGLLRGAPAQCPVRSA